ncbi:hypothetical protein SPAR81_1777 [Streptococcus pneumoniae GA44288]|nr:hypothetical protein SPAR81_1777 [Streptococcus pneumoniae GA44288]EHE01413.1 hypothetical protein SPAR41_1982 [Streptococcus pneumoniae GA16833]
MIEDSGYQLIVCIQDRVGGLMKYSFFLIGSNSSQMKHQFMKLSHDMELS